MRARRSAVKVASEKRAVDKDADAERQTLLRARRRLAAGEPLTKWSSLRSKSGVGDKNRSTVSAIRDPAEFQRVFLRVAWQKQQAILRSVETNRSTAVKGCHASGKTYTAAGESHGGSSAMIPRW